MDRDFVSRRAGRYIPANSVTVALLEENLPIAYGVVRDISEVGACIMTDTVLSPGRSFQFRMSFFGGEILEAVARVIWHETVPPSEGGSHGVPHGIEFTDIHTGHRDNLKRILDSRAFDSKSGDA